MRVMALLLAACCLAAPLGAQDGLSAAQALYADARYEEALKAFDALKAFGTPAPRTALAVEQGRAFCLLALDRGAEAQQAIELLLHLDPFFRPSADEAPPKIRNVFRDVRRRALAGVLQEVYERAKQAYERKAYDEAVVGFGQVLALLDDPDLVLDAGPRADMRLVANAFADLAKAASLPPPSTPPSTPPSAPPTGSPAPAGAAVADAPAAPRGETVPAGARGGASTEPLYDAASKDVTAPVPQRTDVPIPDSLRRFLSIGDVVVELIVSATGAVESATVRQSPDAAFGAVVARAVMDWRYRPASRAGKPVRYRIMTKVVVSR